MAGNGVRVEFFDERPERAGSHRRKIHSDSSFETGLRVDFHHVLLSD